MTSGSTAGLPAGAPTLRLSTRSVLALVALFSLLAGMGFFAAASSAHAAGTLLSQGKPTTASSAENGGSGASLATDGNTGTRWSSTFADPQWIQVDLGSSQTISQVVLNWEAAYGKAYQIQTSADGTNWTSIYSTTTGAGGVETLNVTGTGRYVRMYGTARATGYGYSLWEFQVYGGATPPPPTCSTTNSAQGKTATSSSNENAGTTPDLAVDGNTGTRWASAFADPQWLQVDLGSTQSICKVGLNWEAAYGKAYQIQTSADGTNWTSIYSTTTGAGGIETLNVSGTGRYVRMYGTVRGTGYGYSLWEFSVFTGSGGTTTPTPTPTPTQSVCPTYSDTPNFGPNVHIYDHTMTDAAIQASLDSIFNAQKDTNTAQFGTRRDAELFKPSTTPYNVNANIGFNTSILGAGLNPDDVRINGSVTVDAFNASDAGNATQNFWRSAENLSINTNGGNDRWAVAQAAPFRRIHVIGNLDLFPASYGWASGGYISDTKVDGVVSSASQQQWYSKDSNFGSWTGSNWNMVFSGVTGAPANTFPNPPMTVLGTSPVSRDVPYLYIDAAGKYRVFVPSLRTNASGTSWPNTPGTSIPMSQFYVAHEGDATSTIQTALDAGCNVFFTPGIYHVSSTLHVTKANTVVLGIGMATIVPDNGVNGMDVANVDGVRIKGLLFDAGTTNSNTLLTVGSAGSAGTSHAANPTTVQDVFFRIGGAVAGKATNSLVVNSSDTIVDHIWAWRADHGAGIGWTVNTADTGMIVNGNNVTAEGLFVEHFQKYEVIWNGQGGKIIFFQNEMPYDPPNQAAYMNGSLKGYAAIKVADTVTSFEAWGLGSYCYFNVDPTIHNSHAFESPVNANVKWHDMVTVSLNNDGVIENVINSTGGPTGAGTAPHDLVAFP
ncbi:MAG: hypothetical protein QOF57_1401 [Frankiaceae bacterium]|nr:hypothetical protein [Frankiaceae bacterium]